MPICYKGSYSQKERVDLLTLQGDPELQLLLIAIEIQEWFAPGTIPCRDEDKIAKQNSCLLLPTLGTGQVCDLVSIYRSVDGVKPEFASWKQVKDLVCNAPTVTLERSLEIQSIVWRQWSLEWQTVTKTQAESAASACQKQSAQGCKAKTSGIIHRCIRRLIFLVPNTNWRL